MYLQALNMFRQIHYHPRVVFIKELQVRTASTDDKMHGTYNINYDTLRLNVFHDSITTGIIITLYIVHLFSLKFNVSETGSVTIMRCKEAKVILVGPVRSSGSAHQRRDYLLLTDSTEWKTFLPFT
jgi:hypothetical protein